MRFNNRAMALAGIPDLPEEAFKHNGDRKIKPQGGGGGGQTTSTGTTYTSNIPEYLQPYVEDMMEATQKEIYQYDAKGNRTGFKPFQSYAQYDQARGGTGETVAGFTPMQTKAMQGIQNYQLPGQTQYGSQMAGMAGLGSMQAGNQYAQQATNPYAMQAYMSPYMEGAVAPELREAARQSAMQGQANQAQAVQQGAFGGSRSAIIEAERQRNLGQQQADIYGKGMQNAYQNAQQAQQFGSTLNLQGLGQGLEGAKTLGALGQQQYGQELGVMGQQLAVGKQQQDYEQSRLNQILQDYGTSQQYPLMQLGVLNAMTRGLPMQSSSSQMYQAQPSGMSQAMGSIGAGLELYKTAKSAFGANGGEVKEYANGGIATGVPPAKLPSMLEKLSDDQLGKKDQDKETDPATKQMVGAEQVRRGALRGGIKTMAAGGAIAFNGEGRSDVEDKEKDKEKKDKKEETTNEGILKALEKSPTTPAEGTNPIPPVAPETDPFTGLDTYPDLKGSVADEARKGIAAAKPAVGPTREDLYAAQEKVLKDQAAIEKTKSERTVNQVIAAQDAERKAAGFVDPAIAEGKTLDERKAKIAGDTREAAQDRLTKFLIDWGKTPGPALNGIINAGDKLIEGNIEDKKLRKKLLEDLEDARLLVNRGVYERRLGNEKEARTEIAKAGEQYYAINEKILQHKEKVYLKQLDLENKIAQMELKGEIAALKGQNKTAIVQQAEIKARAYVQKYVKEITAGTMTVEQIEDMALNEVLARQPAVTAAQTAVVPNITNAATNQGKAETDIAEAETKRFDAITKRNEKVALEIRNSLVLGEGRKQVLAAEEKARKAGGDAAAVKAAGAAVADRITKEVEAKNPIPQAVRTQTPAPAPAVKPAPAKPKGKEAEPAAPKVETPPKISDVQGAPDGAKIGKRISAGKYEVLDSAGKLIGHTS